MIRKFAIDDFEEVLTIHKICFESFSFDYGKYMDTYKKFFSAERTYVAEADNKIVGAACFSLLNDSFQIEDGLKNRLEYYILGINNPVYTTKIFEPYQHPFSTINDSDIVNTSCFVLPEYRRRHIGMRLTLERILRAKECGSAQVFVDCWEGGNSSKLYSSLGFIPIARKGPSYPDGSCAIIMGKKL